MEYLRSGAAMLSLASVLGLGACSGSSEQSTATSTPVASAAYKRTEEYLPDGSRITRYEKISESPAGYRYYPPSDKLAYCDGGDLVEIGLRDHRYSDSTFARSVGHKACNDGKLTPTDFPVIPVK